MKDKKLNKSRANKCIFNETFSGSYPFCGYEMVMIWGVWNYMHGCHAHFTEGSAAFRHFTRNLTKNQNFSKILFACFQVKPEASKWYIKHFSICNIKGAEKFSWSLPVHLFQESLVWTTLWFVLSLQKKVTNSKFCLGKQSVSLKASRNFTLGINEVKGELTIASNCNIL